MHSPIHQHHTILDLRTARSQGEMRAEVQKNVLVERAPYVCEEREPSRLHAVRAPLARVCAILLVVGLSSQVLPSFARSLAYFTDTEGSPAHMSTGVLDLTVTDPLDTVIGCGDMADLEVPVYATTSGFFARVSASTTHLTGNADFCQALDLSVRYTGTSSAETVYTGSLEGFRAPSIGTGTLRFIAELPSGLVFSDTTSCTMHLGFKAWLAPNEESDSGFSDQESTQVTFVVEPGSCVDCPPPPCSGCAGGNTTVITNTTNIGTVTNTVSVTASTGGNTSTGGNGGNGGSGGTGGAGGAGGASGGVVTGDASAQMNITNTVNTNTTTIDLSGGCACGTSCPCGQGDTSVTTNTENTSVSTTDTSVVGSTSAVDAMLARMREELDRNVGRRTTSR
jgi:uncharacterized membrane protein YgcG